VIDAKGITMSEKARELALPGEECRAAPHTGWSDLEAWVWHQVGSGRIADINQKLGRTADPKQPEEWGPERLLRPRFLETILLHGPWRSAIPRQGVRIVGALFDETVDLVDADVDHPLGLEKSLLMADIRLLRSRLKFLSLSGSANHGKLNLDSASVDGNLYLRCGAALTKIDLRNAFVNGQISLICATVTGRMVLDSCIIKGSLLMRGMRTKASVRSVGARIDGQLDMKGATIKSKMIMEWISIGRSLNMRKADISCPINLTFAVISGSIDLRGAALAGLDLSGARVTGELRLASNSRSPTWSKNATLILRNARVGSVQNPPEAWPNNLDMAGFAYDRFGGFEGDPATPTGKRGSKWFIEWLARDEPYTPQPYHQCAEVLREMGHPEMANDVLYAGRERERKEASERKEQLRWIGLSLLSWTIGYGYGQRYFRSLWWVAGITVLGSMMLLIGGQSAKTGGGLLAGLFFSLDLLLPIIQLHEPHYRIVLDGLAKYYFAIHKLMGYVLASFLIAGLAGLTK
jgi:uncharacterized protein YjbI with pentapeptide repeats